MMIRLRLVGVREKQDVRLSKEFPGEPQARGGAFEETPGDADLGVTRQIGQP